MSKRQKVNTDNLRRVDMKKSSVSRVAKKNSTEDKKSFIEHFFKDEKTKPKSYRKKQKTKPTEQTQSGTEHRAKIKKPNVLKVITSLIKRILPKKSKSEILTRESKKANTKTIKRKQIIAYAVAGTAIIAVTLAFIFVPISEAKDTISDAGEETDTDLSYAAMAMSQPTPTPIKTTLPEMTRPEVTGSSVTVSAEEEDLPTVQPTESQTVKPTVTPKPTPIKTTTPAPTPTPTEKPTPTPEPTPTPTPEPSYDMDDLTKEYRVVADIYYNEMGFYTNYYEYTDEELTILARVIHREARGESLTGKIAVGNVVMNRVLNSQRFGNTIKAVVVDSGEFAYSESTVPSKECITAATLVLKDQKWTVPQNIYNFKASGGDWGSHTFYKQIDHHYFYSHNYSGRSNSDDIPPMLFERIYEWPRYGCKPGTRVRRVQAMLASLDYDVSPDGYFGKSTEEALKKFQSDFGLKSDGVAGPSTLSKLISKYGTDKYIDDFVE